MPLLPITQVDVTIDSTPAFLQDMAISFVHFQTSDACNVRSLRYRKAPSYVSLLYGLLRRTVSALFVRFPDHCAFGGAERGTEGGPASREEKRFSGHGGLESAGPESLIARSSRVGANESEAVTQTDGGLNLIRCRCR
ncbi:hypothetical protein NK8_82680 (plasmid) [Caballeronia sp. NK8]|nr:hypothetical protein NK8_67470 [Caballeronia sp. NK8]BCQ30077.1 hypothetical protein NK8_82680 [Caballeronia sp. NK8]